MEKNKLPIEWTKNDLHEMALKIKEHPEDVNLKNIFLNLIPDTGDSFNLQLYMILKNCYYIYSGKYHHYCSLDDYIEMNLFHIYRRSFSDWNPEYSLATYFKLLTRPNGIIGKIIIDEIKRYSIIDSFTDLEEIEMEKPEIMDDTYTYIASFDKPDKDELMKEILPVLGITADELRFLLILNGKNFHTKNLIETVNMELGTEYTLKELKTIRSRIIRKLRKRADKIRKYFNLQPT